MVHVVCSVRHLNPFKVTGQPTAITITIVTNYLINLLILRLGFFVNLKVDSVEPRHSHGFREPLKDP